MIKNFFYSLLWLLIFFLGFFIFAVNYPVSVTVPNVIKQPLLIYNVNLVNVENGSIQANQSVWLDNGQIIRVAQATPQDSNDIKVIDGTNKYLMPGLWDMHTHNWFNVSSYLHYPLYIANGVTGIRDMASCASLDAAFYACNQVKAKWSEDALNAQAVGPRLLAAGNFPISSSNHVTEGFPSYLSPKTVEDAKLLIDETAKRQWDFIKLYSQIPREVYFAILQQAKVAGIEVSGHLPLTIDILDAIRAGQKTFEHASILPIECSNYAQTLHELTDYPKMTDLLEKVISSYSQNRCQRVLTSMAQNDVWYTPTHVTRRYEKYAADKTFLADERLKYIQHAWRIVWHMDAKRMQKHLQKANGQQVFDQFYELGLKLTGQAHQAGVNILLGSDATDTYSFPGFSLHDEMDLLVEAGLSPADVLKVATINAAKYLKLQHQYGSVTEGKVADLLLLKANPLEDIRNTRQIESVLFNGYHYQQQDLSTALESVEVHSNSVIILCKVFWQLLGSQEFKNMFAD